MKFFVGSIILFLVLSFYIYRYYLVNFNSPVNKEYRFGKDIKKLYVLLFFLIAFVVRMLIVFYNVSKGSVGFYSDVNNYKVWANDLYNNGLSSFYTSGGYACCPPGYVYILYILGAVLNITGLGEWSSFYVLILKLPAILADVGLAYLCYRLSGIRNNINRFGALAISLFIVMNPMTILDSAIWGQNDSVFVFFVVLSLYLIAVKKNMFAYISYFAAVLISPQAVMFAPVILFSFIRSVMEIVRSRKDVAKNIAIQAGALAGSGIISFLLILPFGIKEAFAEYYEYANSLSYGSCNAYNFWELIGQGWMATDSTVIGIPINVLGAVFMVAVVAVSAVLFFRNIKSDSIGFFLAAFISIAIFTLAVKMHERYLFPAAIFAIFAFVMRPRIETYILAISSGLVSFFNMFHVLYYFDSNDYSRNNPVTRTVCIMEILVFALLIVSAIRLYVKNRNDEARGFEDALKANVSFFERMKIRKGEVHHSTVIARMTKKDYIIVCVIMFAYMLVAFYHLGNMSAPTSEYSLVTEGPVTLDFGEEKHIGQMWIYLGHEFDQNYTVTYSSDGQNWYYLHDEQNQWQTGAVYNWNKENVDLSARYLYIAPASTTRADAVIELAFRDVAGNLITPVNAENYHNLFDEQEFAPTEDTYMNGTYFDEVHYTRHIHEMKQGIYTYENTHPQLGKEIMAIGTFIFGMNPFGWRFMGTICGIIMIFAMYVFSKKFFDSTTLATVTTLVFTSDFMHFVQTRIATIDVYAVMFIMISYIFVYEYTQLNFYETPLRKTFIPLFWCGLFAGLAICSKWTGVYSAAGIAFILLVQYIYRYKEYNASLSSLDKEMKPGRSFDVVKTFNRYAWKTVGWCLLVFIVIPLIIYTLTYIPFNDGVEGRDLITKMIEAQKTMFNYHTQLVATHAYSSDWYQWPVMYKPVLYVIENVSAEIRRDIVLMGNPAIWWVGMPVSVYMIYLWLNEKDRKAGFLLVGYLAQYLPWMLVERYTFIYHYFASVPFITVMCVYAFDRLGKRFPKINKAVFVYCGICILLFIMFLPILNGSETPVWYIEHILHWSEKWAM